MRRTLTLTVPVVIGLVLGAVVCFRQVSEADAGWHVATGRLVTTSGVPFRNALTWTATDQPYYATSWLYDLLAATLNARLGVAGLQLLTLVLVAITVIALALTCLRIAPGRTPWLVPVAVLLLREGIAERPHVASWALLALVLWLCVPGGFARRVACVLLIALGSNLHAGAAFPAVTLCLFCGEAFLREGRRRREIAVVVAAFAALLANPGGWRNLGYLIENIHVRSVINIREMEPPSVVSVFALILPLGLWAAWRVRRSSAALGLTAVLYALLALRAVRFTNDFAIVATVAGAWALSRVARGQVVAVVALVAEAAIAAPFYGALRLGSVWNEQELPVRAARFIQNVGLSGRMFNSFRDGGFLEQAMPGQLWFQDARVQAFPGAFFRREQEAESSPERWADWMHELGVEWAVASRMPEHLAGHDLFDTPEWALVYWDDISEVCVRRDVTRFAALIASQEYRHFRPDAPVTVASASPSELAEWDAELRRYEETSPRSGLTLVIHCAVRRRIGTDPDGACRRAVELAQTNELRRALAQVQAMPVGQ